MMFFVPRAVLIAFFSFYFCNVVAFLNGSAPDEAAAYGRAALAQIQILKDVVNARANHFSSSRDVTLALAYLSDVQKNLQLFIDDSQTVEIGWFLVEQVAKIIGTVGNDVWAGNDISRYLNDFSAWADIDATRVWSTTFCIEVRRCIFDKLLKALRLIPLTISERRQRELPSTACQPLRAPGMEWRRAQQLNGWEKMPIMARAAIIGSIVAATLIGAGYMVFRLRERRGR